MSVHVHTSDCIPGCNRQEDVDTATSTGRYQITSRKFRTKEKPRWWPLTELAIKTLINLLGIAGLAWLYKVLGLGTPPVLP